MASTSQLSPFSNVIVGVDGGPGGRDAIALARLLVAPKGRLTLAHVFPSEEHPTRASSPSYDAAAPEAAAELLAAELEAADLAAETVVVGSPSVARGLHHLVADHDAELLVVGSCRRGIAGRVMLGDDARGSLRGATCAVAVAPREFVKDTDRIRAIGVGYYDGDESKAALALAREIAARLDARVRVMTVVTPPRVGYGVPLAIEFIEDGVRERLDSLEGVDGEVGYGVAARTLAEFGETVDLLIVGSHDRGAFRRLVFGSTSQNLARTARCPVIVVPRTVVEHESEPDEAASIGAPA